MSQKIRVILTQLGSPRSPSKKDVRVYLKDFLGDPRVVDSKSIVWKLVLYLIVLPFRPKRSAEAYGRIWNGKSFPLIDYTNLFVNKIAKYLPADLEISSSFILSYPRFKDIFSRWSKEQLIDQTKKVLVIPQFPQYAESTSASVFDTMAAALKEEVNIPRLDFISSYHHSRAFIDHSVTQIENHLEKFKNQAGVDALVLSFHGIPMRRVLEKKDIYYRHCVETYLLITERLKNIQQEKIHLCFQSRFGSEQWLGPSTDQFVEHLVKEGKKRVAIYCPSFVVDCLETVDEIGNELADEVKEIGGEVLFIPCLNDQEEWAKDYADLITVEAKGSMSEKEKYYYQIDEKIVREKMPEQKYDQPPLSPQAKSTLKIVFLTTLLDLVGFSIIFPMFPAMAQYYLANNGDDPLLMGLFGFINQMTSNESTFSAVVLFGGLLGALYSLLNFISAPIWGAFSDRWGRKPILLITVFGLCLSYVLWFFSGSFTLLVLARFLGGLMGGNLSTATAVVADVTDTKNRSKGMASIGIAFALGFVFGPAIGGILSKFDLTTYFAGAAEYGINPFSAPALFAALLSLFNLWLIIKKLPETLPKEKRGTSELERTSNPIKLFKPFPYAGVNLVNYTYFLFLMAFSGMEFTLTFLAVERFHFSPMDNGYMFLFIGFVIAMVQGGYVRRKASIVGEKKMALTGLIILIPGLVMIGLADSLTLLYVGLFFLSAGSAMTIPCLTSLVSLRAPSSVQGRVLGIFRSLGALARVVGPIIASLIYWQYGTSYPYLLGAGFLLVPILVLFNLKESAK